MTISSAKEALLADGSLIEGVDPLNAVYEADGRMTSFVAALDGAGGYDAKRELFLQAIEDGQFERDLRTLFGALRAQSEAGQ